MQSSERLLAPRTFIAIDCLLVGFALVAAFCSADQVKLSNDLGGILAMRLTVQNLLRAAEVFVFWAVLMRCFRVYSIVPLTSLSEALRIAAAVTGTTAFLAWSFDEHHKGASAEHIAENFAIFCFVSLYGLRAVVSLLSHRSHSGLLGRRSVLIVGTGPRAVRSFRQLRTQFHRSHDILGFVDSHPTSLTPGEVESLFMGSLADLESILLDHVIDEVIIALPARSCYSEIEQTVAVCARVGIEVKYPDDLLSFITRRTANQKKGAHPVLHVVRPAVHDPRLLVKRFVDIVVSSVALLLLAPVMLIIAVVVKSTSPGPVFFLQERYGLCRRRFRMFKFRTMVADAEAKLKDVEGLNEAHGPIFKIRNDPRVTKPGAFLRRTSLDELPQLFNVLFGHMSLVGPRPMSVRDVSLFDQAWLMRRFSVKPGMTCLWQVNGRSNTSFHRWIELDLHYIDNWSLGLDAKILALTIPAVVKGSGAM